MFNIWFLKLVNIFPPPLIVLGGWHFLRKGGPKNTGVKFLERKLGGVMTKM